MKSVINIFATEEGLINYLGVVVDKEYGRAASLVAQWLRIHLPMQATRVQALVQEDPTCHGATKPMHQNY